MDTGKKTKIVENFKQQEGDTGSTEVQVALLTERIKQLTEHLIANKHDFQTKRTLLQLGARRKRLLSYLSREDVNRYNKLVAELGLRK